MTPNPCFEPTFVQSGRRRGRVLQHFIDARLLSSTEDAPVSRIAVLLQLDTAGGFGAVRATLVDVPRDDIVSLLRNESAAAAAFELFPWSFHKENGILWVRRTFNNLKQVHNVMVVASSTTVSYGASVEEEQAEGRTALDRSLAYFCPSTRVTEPRILSQTRGVHHDPRRAMPTPSRSMLAWPISPP